MRLSRIDLEISSERRGSQPTGPQVAYQVSRAELSASTLPKTGESLNSLSWPVEHCPAWIEGLELEQQLSDTTKKNAEKFRMSQIWKQMEETRELAWIYIVEREREREGEMCCEHATRLALRPLLRLSVSTSSVTFLPISSPHKAALPRNSCTALYQSNKDLTQTSSREDDEEVSKAAASNTTLADRMHLYIIRFHSKDCEKVHDKSDK